MSDWRKFFERHGENSIRFTFFENVHSTSVEELYQMFRGRLLDEIFQAACQRGDDELASTIERALNADQSKASDS